MAKPTFVERLESALVDQIDADSIVEAALDTADSTDPAATQLPFAIEVEDEDLGAVLLELYECNPPEEVEAWLRSSLSPAEFESKLAPFVIDDKVYFAPRGSARDDPKRDAT